MNKTRFAIISCGKIALRYAVHIQTYGELVVVCDVMEDKAKLLADQYHVPFFTLVDDFLLAGLEIDVEVICTPNRLHANQAIQIMTKFIKGL